MKVIDFEDIELCEDMCKRVIFDENVRTFFENLTKISREISKLDETTKEKEIKDLKPDLSNVSNKMNQLIRSGIDIDDKEWWLSEKLYSSNSYLGNLYFDSSILALFLNVNFNGIKLDFNDFDYLGSRITLPEVTSPAPIKLVEDYSVWLQNNKKLEKKIEKAEKKYLTISNGKKKAELKSQISFMKTNLERGNQMKQRIEFFEGLSNEQITLIHEIFNEVKSAKTKYDQNRKKINAITKKYKNLQTETYERAFIKLIEQGITQSEISTIITKMFKTIFVRELMGSDTTLPDTVPEKYLADIDFKSLEWFLIFKEDEFTKLHNEIFSHFDFFYECFEEKVLKKK